MHTPRLFMRVGLAALLLAAVALTRPTPASQPTGDFSAIFRDPHWNVYGRSMTHDEVVLVLQHMRDEWTQQGRAKPLTGPQLLQVDRFFQCVRGREKIMT